MKNEEIYDEPSVFAIPCDKPFVISADKAKEFMKIKPNPEVSRKREELLKKLNIEGPILKKTIK